MTDIFTVRMLPGARTLQARRATWEAYLARTGTSAPGVFRRTSTPAATIRAALAATDAAVVRVTLDEDAAREVVRQVGVSG